MKSKRAMNPKWIPTLFITLLFLAVGLVFTGCGEKKGGPAEIRDQADRIVQLPEKVEAIVSLWPEATRVIYALGAQDMLVGLDSHSRTCPILAAAFPEVKDKVDVGSPLRGTFSIESLAGLSPDIVFTRTDDQELADEIQESLGIPVICVRIHPMLKEYSFDLFTIIGKCIGKEKQGMKLQDYLEQQMASITSITSDIPDSERPAVYQAFAQDLLKTIATFDVIDLAGGRSVAEGGGKGSAWYSVNFEDVLSWNPDIVILHGFGRFTPEDLNADQGWQQIKAVENGKVFKLTLGWAGWDPGGFVINVMQNAKVFHPDKFGELNVEERANAIFEEIYGVEGLYTELKKEYGLSL